MEFKFKKTSVSLAEGVDGNKFGALRAIAVTPEEVKNLFLAHGYNLEGIQGIFLKAFAMNAAELKEVEDNLIKIEKMGMQQVFQANMQIRYFRDKFMRKLERCIAAGLPYLNSDNTFASFFANEEEFEDYLLGSKNKNTIPVNEDKILKEKIELNNLKGEISNKNKINMDDNKLDEMSPEDRQVYNEIVERLNYLVLASPMDTMLATVVNNATNKAVDAILRQEYKFLGVREMVESVMFDGLDVTPEDNKRITSLVLGAFPDEERKMM